MDINCVCRSLLKPQRFSYSETYHRLRNTWFYEPVTKSEHPTQKPVALIENIIRHSSNEGDLVLDPFAGSGTSAVAAANLGRRYICIEKEREYCDIAEQRLMEPVQLKMNETDVMSNGQAEKTSLRPTRKVGGDA